MILSEFLNLMNERNDFNFFHFDLVAPNAPLPTRPPEPTKKTKQLTVATEIRTEKEPETIVVTDEEKTTEKPTPPLLFSLPDHITDVNILLKNGLKTTEKPKPKIPVKTGMLEAHLKTLLEITTRRGSFMCCFINGFYFAMVFQDVHPMF